MDVTQHNIRELRKRLRALQDKDQVSKRELLGVLFDVYEIFVTLHEDQTEAAMAPMMSELFGPKVYKVSPEEFDEVVKRDKQATKEKASTPSAGPGQYL